MTIDYSARAARYARMPLAHLRAAYSAESVRLHCVVQANIRAEIQTDMDLLREAIRDRIASLTPELESLTALRRQLVQALANARHHDDAIRGALQTSLAHFDVARGLLADQAAAELETEVAA